MTNETLVIGNEVATTLVEGKAGVGITALENAKKGSDFDIDKVAKQEEVAKKEAKLLLREIYFDKVESIHINGIEVALEEGKEIVKRIVKGEVLSYEIDTVHIFTDRFNYQIVFANPTIKLEDGTEKEHQVFYTKAGANFEILNGKIIACPIINPERVIALVRKNKIVTSISEERLVKEIAILNKEYTVSDEQITGNGEYIYHAGTKQFIILQDTFDNVFFKKRQHQQKQKGNGDYVPKVADYAIHLIENGQYKVRYGKQENPGGKIVYTGNGTRGEAERSYENFVSTVVARQK